MSWNNVLNTAANIPITTIVNLKVQLKAILAFQTKCQQMYVCTCGAKKKFKEILIKILIIYNLHTKAHLDGEIR